MTTLPTLGLLSVSDGRLMDEIGQVYAVVSHFIGRPAYTHELPKYGRLAAPMIVAAFPDMSEDESRDWREVRDAALAAHGAEVVVPDTWAGALADGKGPIANLAEAIGATR